ncbi:hypothetical protein [Neorhodopirellula pilleata]|uniref:hypothetical protein n=1 Tax=Neorhodopirellula pilleata TaxID=2714738 RepID=UPI0011B441FC|nr:hypothetical protein [Neorhodopirellula pilleata]
MNDDPQALELMELFNRFGNSMHLLKSEMKQKVSPEHSVARQQIDDLFEEIRAGKFPAQFPPDTEV